MAKEKNEGEKEGNWFARHKFLTGLIIFIILYAIGSSQLEEAQQAASNSANNNTPQQEQAEAEKNEPVATVTAQELVNAYDANGVAADAQYKGKLVTISGTIESIDKDFLNTPYITLASGNIVTSVQCMFDDAEQDTLARLQKGESVVVTGIVQGTAITNVMVKECKLQSS